MSRRRLSMAQWLDIEDATPEQVRSAIARGRAPRYVVPLDLVALLPVSKDVVYEEIELGHLRAKDHRAPGAPRPRWLIATEDAVDWWRRHGMGIQ